MSFRLFAGHRKVRHVVISGDKMDLFWFIFCVAFKFFDILDHFVFSGYFFVFVFILFSCICDIDFGLMSIIHSSWWDTHTHTVSLIAPTKCGDIMMMNMMCGCIGVCVCVWCVWKLNNNKYAFRKRTERTFGKR